MKLTKNQQAIVNRIKSNGRVWINPAVSPGAFRQCCALVNKGVLRQEIQGSGMWFDLAN